MPVTRDPTAVTTDPGPDPADPPGARSLSCSTSGSSGRIEQAIRRMLGIDLKMKQYAEGSRFVRAVVEEVGMPAFNKVWTSPETLPTKAEFAHPHEWVERVASGS